MHTFADPLARAVQIAPHKAALLYCRAAPSAGGDTMFSNQYFAFESLSPGMQAMHGGRPARVPMIGSCGVARRPL